MVALRGEGLREAGNAGRVENDVIAVLSGIDRGDGCAVQSTGRGDEEPSESLEKVGLGLFVDVCSDRALGGPVGDIYARRWFGGERRSRDGSGGANCHGGECAEGALHNFTSL